MGVTANEVLVLDSSTFVREIGLTSKGGSALKHYLYLRGIQLVVPEVVAEECEQTLTKRAVEKRKIVNGNLQWLGRFLGKMNDWLAPDDETIAGRAKAIARAEHLSAVVIPETAEVRQRAKLRDQFEQPPSHRRSGLSDCQIWEQCLDLLARRHVVFVSGDSDFCGHRYPKRLHPTLQAEANNIADDRSLTYHPTIESLLSELKSEMEPLPDSVVFAFVYEALDSVIEELASNSGCRPKRVGQVKQTLLTTDQASVIEVRLEITDIWEGSDKSKDLNFRFSGSCHYLLEEKKLCDLTPMDVALLTEQPDGSVRAVQGSVVRLSARMNLGTSPIKPEPEKLSTWVSKD